MQDTILLNFLVENSGYKMRHLAHALDITTVTLRRKLDGRTDFKLSEAEKLAALLRLTAEQREQCFFGTAYNMQCRADMLNRRCADDERAGKQYQKSPAQMHSSQARTLR